MKYDPRIVLEWFKAHGLDPQPEHRFHSSRKWRFDFAFLPQLVALEVEGGVWTGGRHTRGSGFMKDVEKYNSAAELGWRILRCVPNDLCTVETITMIKRALDSMKTCDGGAIDFLTENGVEIS